MFWGMVQAIPTKKDILVVGYGAQVGDRKGSLSGEPCSHRRQLGFSTDLLLSRQRWEGEKL